MGISVQLRRGTAAEWAAADPVLLAGELGAETDTDKIKIGNGVDVYSDLDYLSTSSIAAFLENPPTEDDATKAPSSEWAFDHEAADTGVHGAGGDTLAVLGDIIDPADGFQLSENCTINLVTVLSADGKFSGIGFTATAGENLAGGEMSYFKAADSKFWKTDANAEATTKPFAAMATAAIAADAPGLFLWIGTYREDDWNWTLGAPLFFSETAGALTESPPSSSGTFIRCAGHAGFTANEAHIKPDTMWWENT